MTLLSLSPSSLLSKGLSPLCYLLISKAKSKKGVCISHAPLPFSPETKKRSDLRLCVPQYTGRTTMHLLNLGVLLFVVIQIGRGGIVRIYHSGNLCGSNFRPSAAVCRKKHHHCRAIRTESKLKWISLSRYAGKIKWFWTVFSQRHKKS